VSHNKLRPSEAAALIIPAHAIKKLLDNIQILALTVIFVFVYPAVTFLGLHHKFIIPKASVYKGIDKCPSQISASRVDI
jgi:hypothetical protein